MHNTHVHVHDIVYMDYCTVYRVVFLKVEIFVNTKFGPFENFLLYCIIHVTVFEGCVGGVVMYRHGWEY